MRYLKYIGIIGPVVVLAGTLLVWAWTTRQLSVGTDYPPKVLEALAFKDVDRDPGFQATMTELIGDMECETPETGKSLCKLPIRFQHLRILAQQDFPRIKNYEGQICKLRPAEQYQADHTQLCNSLEKISRELDTMQLTASQAGQFLHENKPESLGTVLDEIVNRLERTRQSFISRMKTLSEIAWLKPALPALPTK
ncbi:hypothetical protein HYR54_04345 [Candidatus Acetothermia bacterium]|nr:hypothetical protein [Candidatus Acetothermia bacterium]